LFIAPEQCRQHVVLSFFPFELSSCSLLALCEAALTFPVTASRPNAPFQVQQHPQAGGDAVQRSVRLRRSFYLFQVCFYEKQCYRASCVDSKTSMSHCGICFATASAMGVTQPVAHAS
jgi:hypothetical protein